MGKKECITYLALGDSLTEGIGATRPDGNFVRQFFQHMKHSEHCRVRNFGISGITSSELYQMMNNPAIYRLLKRASHVSITTGGNDFIQMYERGGLTLKRLDATVTSLCDHVSKIMELVKKCNRDAIIYLLGFYAPVPAYSLGEHMICAFIEETNSYYEKICKHYQVEWVNPFQTFFRRLDYFSDEVHPNQEGYDELAKLFISTFK